MGKPKAQPLPPNYAKLLQWIEWELGVTFSDRPDNIGLLAQHMDWRPRQVYAILGILTHNGVLSWNPKRRTWSVVQSGRDAA